jgi:choline dehydrogenase
MGQKYDYIIIGAGTTGGVIAKTISDCATESILVLDMGKDHIDDPRVQRADQMLIADSEACIIKDYDTTRDSTMNLNRYDITRGIGWGGSTASSNMVASKASKGYLNILESMTGISAMQLEAGYREVEKYISLFGSTDATRGNKGLMTISQLHLGSSFLDMLPEDLTNDSTPNINQLVATDYATDIVNDYNMDSVNDTLHRKDIKSSPSTTKIYTGDRKLVSNI